MRSSPFARTSKIDESQEAPPTRQTVEKLRPDRVRQLFHGGALKFHHVAAADEVRAIVEAIQAAHFPSRQMDGDMPHGGGNGCDWTDRLSVESAAAWRHKYTPWANQMAVSCGNSTRLDLVFEIVIESRGLRTTEQRIKIQHGTAINVLRFALDAW